MRILVLGGSCMIGQQLLRQLQVNHDVKATLPWNFIAYESNGLLHEGNTYSGIDGRSIEKIHEAIMDFQPEVVINAIRNTSHRKFAWDQQQSSKEKNLSLEINALLPHRLSMICKTAKIRLIHFSTDCIFSGKEGNYREDFPVKTPDLYGMSKYLGEVADEDCITLRFSSVGLDLFDKTGLVEWSLEQKGIIQGFTNALYTGLTTVEAVNAIEFIIEKQTNLSGIWHIASKPISKYSLLKNLTEKLGRKDLIIEKNNNFYSDRSLDGTKFQEKTGYMVPSWDAMLDNLSAQIQERG
jgi:dTDP-4-dehydrorhamnose reductase